MSIDHGTLYVVATPIGNLADVTQRALEILSQVDMVAAEDTRHSSQLLRHFNINRPMLSLHEHNERQLAEQVVRQLQDGKNIALISDAGTPLVSDPGYVLVREARRAGIRIVPVPGASALLAALSVAGLPTDRFIFEGFLSAKAGARKSRLQDLGSEPRTMVFYEAPHRVLDTLVAMRDQFGGEHPVVVARELTKTFETILSGGLEQVLEQVSADPNQQRGEFVVLLAGVAKQDSEIPAETLRVLQLLLEELPVKQAARLAASITGEKKNILYKYALEMTQGNPQQ